MFESVGAAVYRPLSATSARRRPGHVGAAVALGIACGLLLTKSLLGPLLLLAIYFLPVHLPIAMLTTIGVASVSGLLAPVAGLLGIWSMKITPVQQWVGGLQAYPLAAWLRLNNSVAHGSMLIALAQLLPSFLVVRSFARWARAQSEFVSGTSVRGDVDHQQELVPAIAFLDDSFREEFEAEVVKPTDKPTDKPATEVSTADTSAKNPTELETTSKIALTGSSLMTTSASDPINALEAHLRSDSTGPLSTQEVANRASELANLVGDILSSIESAGDVTGESGDPTSVAEAAPISRDDSQEDESTLSGKVDRMPNQTQTLKWPEKEGSFSGAAIAHNHQPHASPVSTAQASVRNSRPEAARHEEALRYLLHHLKEIQEKV
ncbi:MAG: hypothetical protein NXI32_06640 [bacterium]|nr:hypothetical protein [bacterium]